MIYKAHLLGLLQWGWCRETWESQDLHCQESTERERIWDCQEPCRACQTWWRGSWAGRGSWWRACRSRGTPQPAHCPQVSSSSPESCTDHPETRLWSPSQTYSTLSQWVSEPPAAESSVVSAVLGDHWLVDTGELTVELDPRDLSVTRVLRLLSTWWRETSLGWGNLLREESCRGRRWRGSWSSPWWVKVVEMRKYCWWILSRSCWRFSLCTDYYEQQHWEWNTEEKAEAWLLLSVRSNFLFQIFSVLLILKLDNFKCILCSRF